MLTEALQCCAGLVIGDSTWLWPAVAIGIAGVLLAMLLGLRRHAAGGLAVCLRVTGWLLITACLVNPLWSSARPRQGANVFAVVVDTSRSQTVQDSDRMSRAEWQNELLEQGERSEARGWLQRIDEQFELRRYTISDHVQRASRLDSLEYDGQSSRLESGLTQLTQRFRDQPLAGVLLFTDGNATDAGGKDWQKTAPVYPVLPDGDMSLPPDLAIHRVRASQSAFDDAPVAIDVNIQTSGVTRGNIRVSLVDADGDLLESQTVDVDSETPVRFEIRPKTAGTVFYRVHAALLDEKNKSIQEATEINNSRLVAVDRGSKPRKVLYVSGRPNWEFKFLRRAIETDPQTTLIGLIRIARKEARFEFRGRGGDRSNSLFRGFDAEEQEIAEEYDEPVLVRLGTADDEELMSGFPDNAADLFQYDALILDDIEAEFFTADQQQLIRDFVSRRGGGLLMLGGQESFRQGEYDRTPIGEMLPVDLRKAAETATGNVRLNLTREGWLQPWVRLRADEGAEQARRDAMPAFRTLNPALRVRPGAQVMASVSDDSGHSWPALVVQRFGRGRTGALCIGDLWRWRLHEARLQQDTREPRHHAPGTDPWDVPPEEDRGDYSRAARQMIRWLVSDVPLRLDIAAEPAPNEGVHAWQLSATVRGQEYEAREDAQVIFEVMHPDGTTQRLSAHQADDEVGRYDAIVSAGESGPWICDVTATLTGDDGEPEELTALHGWASQPEQQEMASVQLNRPWMQKLAQQTGGHIVDSSSLDSFVDELQTSDAPVMEVLSWPIWHQWSVFVVAIVCFAGDWTIRRRMGYP